ncbi:MAG: ABC transporter substrate-binding protein, partial [Candidatus Niameybacter stercoravium]|nr:ABC transporter substrate-binding protein [Candidatus Niameybacter stercoravium]
MNKKRLLSTVLCGTMLLAAMTGCSQNSAAPSSSNGDQKKTSEASDIRKEETKGAEADTKRYEKFITVDVFDGLANYQGIQSGWFAEIVKEKFNMELNIIAPNVAGGGDTLFQTRSAAGELGDLIITNANGGRLQDLVTAGLVADMTELIKDKKHLEQYTTAIEHLQDLVNEEGVWAIPSDVSAFPATTPSEGLDLTYGPYVRWDA